MEWQAAAALNGVIALCYVLISSLIASGLVRTRQLTANPLAVATAAIFLSCALHHGHHASHLVLAYGTADGAAQLTAVREVFGSWHTLVVDALGAGIALTYLGLRRSYGTLLNTPQMFDDAVRQAAEERLRSLAFTDALTGVPNRAAYQVLADELADTDTDIAVLFLDLDGFKSVNDTWGHEAGDRVLSEIAQRLSDDLAAGEHLFRLGGDEMAVVAVGADRARGEEVVARVRSVLRAPVAAREGSARLTASIGLACGTTAGGIDTLLRDADAAMYEAKKNRVLPTIPRARERHAPASA